MIKHTTHKITIPSRIELGKASVMVFIFKIHDCEIKGHLNMGDTI